MILSELLQLKNNRIRLNTLRDNRESVVPFVGAGISVACGLSSWTTLLEDLASEFLPVNKRIKIDNSTDYLQYAESIVRETGNSNIVMKRIAEMIQSKDILHIIRHILCQKIYVSCSPCKLTFKKRVQKCTAFKCELFNIF